MVYNCKIHTEAVKQDSNLQKPYAIVFVKSLRQSYKLQDNITNNTVLIDYLFIYLWFLYWSTIDCF